MSILNCKICNKKFDSYNNIQKCCSDKCKKHNDRLNFKRWVKSPNGIKLYKSEERKKYTREYNNKYFQTKIGKQKIKERQESGKLKESIQKYRKSEKGKATILKRDRSPKYLKKKKEFRESERGKNYFKNYYSEKRKSDPLFKLGSIIRSRIGIFLKQKNMRKNNKTFKWVGCSPKFLKKYLENKFYNNPITKEKMSWKNHTINGWHVDHIIPLSSAKNIGDVERLSHYTNLQPMWAEENLSKGDKY